MTGFPTDGTLNGTNKAVVYDPKYNSRPRAIMFHNVHTASIKLQIYKSYSSGGTATHRQVWAVRIPSDGTFIWDGSEIPALDDAGYITADQSTTPAADINWAHL